jgi:hypothetical protein
MLNNVGLNLGMNFFLIGKILPKKKLKNKIEVIL